MTPVNLSSDPSAVNLRYQKYPTPRYIVTNAAAVDGMSDDQIAVAVATAMPSAKAARSAWIQAARTGFNPGPRQPCSICGRFQALSEAHHIIPLSWQYDFQLDAPDQSHAWLCQTHHAAAHKMLDDLISGTSTYIDGLDPDHREMLDAMLVLPFAKLYGEKLSVMMASDVIEEDAE